ncbi:MAG: hypothetical protein ACH0QD_04440 [Tepidibacillus sp.]
MWGEGHPLPYESKIKEKIVGPLSLDEFGWIALGTFLSYQMSKYVPRIGNDFIFSRIHYLLPIAITWLFAYGIHPRTGLPIGKYLILITKLRLRRRKFLYRKVNTVEGGDRW